MENKQQTESKRSVAGFFFDGAKGITLGISVAIPGLSGGTIAVAEGCYDALIGNISSLRKTFKKSFLYLLPFVLGLLLGAAAAFLGIKKGYEVAPFSLTGLFGGMVLGSLPVTFSELRKGQNAKEKSIHVLAFALCLLLAAGLGIVTALCKIDLQSALVGRDWWMYLYVPFAGFIAAFALIVPGISGSMTMMVFGLYLPLLNTFIPSRQEGSITIWGNSDTAYVLTGLVLALLLVIGILGGIAFASKFMGKLLEKHRVSTFYAILGLIIGSLISMFFNSDIYPKYVANSIQAWDYIVGAILFLVGAAFVFLLLRYSNKRQQKQGGASESPSNNQE